MRCDNRTLLANSPYTRLQENYPAGTTVFKVENPSVFATSQFVCYGEIGNEFTEILKVLSLDMAAKTLTTAAASAFAHSESVRVTYCPYDQVRFYWTAAPAFDVATPLTNQLPLTPSFPFTQFDDPTNTTGYGWFVLSNSVSGASTVSTSPIPYANFGRDTVKKALDGFYSILNNNEQKLVSHDEAIEWLCEAYDEARNELDMNTDDWSASDGTDQISVQPGVAEYDLPADFGEMLTVRSDINFGYPMMPMSINNVDYANWLGFNTYFLPASGWFIRGKKLGFAPTPTTAFIAYYRYKQMAPDLSQYYEVINLPKKAFNCLKDFMLYRAGQKLRRSDYLESYKSFRAKLSDMRLRADNRDNSADMARFYTSSRI